MKNKPNDTKYGIITSNKFNKQLRKIKKQGKDIKKNNYRYQETG